MTAAASPRVPAGVVFDCDGILVDSEPVHERATTQWAASVGIDVAPDFFVRVLGMTVRQQIALLVADTSLAVNTAYAQREARFWSVLDDLSAARSSKPHPEPYQRSVQAMGLSPTACAAVEDSPLGALSATQAGLTVVVVDRDGVGSSAFPASVMVVDDLAHAGRLLLDWHCRRTPDRQ